ncbi:IS110 family transposase [Alishewanella sp. HL-SH06]|uniref:IS110 family transposase n=1 Tax=Alishewanella sp. HL-SH06 TaxID=3461144 RepID=UPI0040437863
MKLNVFGVDIAKEIFQIHWVDNAGKSHSQKVKRQHFLEWFSNKTPSLIAMEACSGAHHWGRYFQKMGHQVRLLAAHKVKPFVIGNKNDMVDARAIWTAVQQPEMRFVAVKTIEQQAALAAHRMRAQLVKTRTASINAVRGFLAEFGLVIPKSRTAFKRDIAPALEQLSQSVPTEFMDRLYERVAYISTLDEDIAGLEQHITAWFKRCPQCQRISKIPGIGVLTATALVATVGDVQQFKSGRELSAWLGLVPKQTGSGGKVKLHGISKRGDTYLRTLLVHGARSAITHNKQPSEWLQQLLIRRPKNVVLLAQANKTARVVWALLSKEVDYSEAIYAQVS